MRGKAAQTRSPTLAGKSDAALARTLEEAVPGGVATRASDRLSFAHDASHYLLVPRAVVTPRDMAEVARLLRVSGAAGVPLTFRSGGTSLSGQAANDGVLVDTRRNFRDVEVLGDGALVRVQPGATVRSVNARLARFGRKLGPDPASETACTIGGIVANNSSGMACGTLHNTYRTLKSAVLVLPAGTVIDTGLPDADERLRLLEPEIYVGLAALRDRVRSNPRSVERVRRLYALKNTMGYSVNSFLDFVRPVDILTHLVIGSEGTLAFVAEATFHTVPAHRFASTGLLLFPSLDGAAASLPPLIDAGFATIELLDAASLQVAQSDPRAPLGLQRLDVAEHAALLVEFQEPTPGALAERIASAREVLDALATAEPAYLSEDSPTRSDLWHIRKGIYAAVAAARPPRTTALLEDVAVPIPELLTTCRELRRLLAEHGYAGGVIFGHAKDGNIHFMINEDFLSSENRDRYQAFTEDMVELVLRSGGTLKAEHGTGRIMAPYVRRQYGDELYNVMREVKQLIDPRALLNPGVLINDDPRAHLGHLKSSPTVEPEVDRCVDCGYCEPVCPSKDLTTTPRRRIALRREIARARQSGDRELANQLEADFRYDGVATCAVDGMCATACPVLIDTGDLTRRLRAQTHTALEQRMWAAAARHWDVALRAAAGALDVAHLLPDMAATGVTALGRAVLGTEVMPAWSRDLPRGGGRRRARRADAAVAVYFPACVSSVFGPAGTASGVHDAVISMCERAGVGIRIPERIASLCCGTPWKSKGMVDGHAIMRERVIAALHEATDGGRLPVVVDATSCTEGLADLLGQEGITVVDAISFAEATLLPRLPSPRRVQSIVVHPTCSTTRFGLNTVLMRLAAATAWEVVQPEDWHCCAFAGDRGLLHPELTAAATAAEARSVLKVDATAFVSANRTCELGMTRATGRPFRHLLEVLDDVTRQGGSKR